MGKGSWLKFECLSCSPSLAASPLHIAKIGNSCDIRAAFSKQHGHSRPGCRDNFGRHPTPALPTGPSHRLPKASGAANQLNAVTGDLAPYGVCRAACKAFNKPVICELGGNAPMVWVIVPVGSLIAPYICAALSTTPLFSNASMRSAKVV
jgi:hypothetical protein